MSCVAFVVAVSLLAAQFTWSRTYDGLCVMMGPGWEANGAYNFEGELMNGKRVYHRQNGSHDNCTDVYLWWDSRYKEWIIGVDHHQANYAYDAYCATQDPTQCDGDWSDGNNLVSQSQVVADACPEWDCDYVNIPDAPDLYCREFDAKLDDEGSNVWHSTANDRYWYFSFVYMDWVCSPQFTSVYACVGVGTWTENYAWIDVERGQTRNIDFEDWIWSDEQNDWVYDGRVSAAVECGPIAATTTTAASTDAILSTSSTRSTESGTNGHNGENESTSTGQNGQNSSKSSSGGATVALTTIVGLVVVCVAILLLILCYRSWRAEQAASKNNGNNIVAEVESLSKSPVSQPLVIPLSDPSGVQPSCAPPQLELAIAGKAGISSDPDPNHPMPVMKRLSPSVENACLAAENDEEVIGDDESEIATLTPRQPPSASISEEALAQLRERVKSHQDSKKNEYERVLEWLVNEVNLPQYFDAFVNNGYDSMAIIARTIDSVDALAEIGITAKGHQKTIMMEIEKLYIEGSKLL